LEPVRKKNNHSIMPRESGASSNHGANGFSPIEIRGDWIARVRGDEGAVAFISGES
jgi:hypothetical protein